jgi:hypothetical protein
MARRPSGGIVEVEEEADVHGISGDSDRRKRVSATATVKGSRGTHDDVLLFSDDEQEGDDNRPKHRGGAARQRLGDHNGGVSGTDPHASQSHQHLGCSIKASWMSASGVTEGMITPGDSMALDQGGQPGTEGAGAQSEEAAEMAAALEAATAEKVALERDKAALEQQASQQQVGRVCPGERQGRPRPC